MKNRKCVVFIFDGYADWEPSLLISGLNQYSDFSVHTVSADGQPITSMGGFRILPDFSLDQLNPDEIDLFVLPGGEAWEQNENQQVTPFIKKILKTKTTLAAICAATAYLAREAILNDIPHTSNGIKYLNYMAPDYKGTDKYLHQPAVASGKIITANGAGFIEFTHEIFKAFDIMEAPLLQAWIELYKSGGLINKFEEA